jgi:hypothetical protein
MLLAIFESPVASQIHGAAVFYANPTLEKILGYTTEVLKILALVLTRSASLNPSKISIFADGLRKAS